MELFSQLIWILCLSVVISQVHGRSITMIKDRTKRCGVIDANTIIHKSRHGRSLGPNTVMDGHWIKETITFAVLNGPKPVPLWVGHPTMSRARVAQLARQAFSEWAPHCGLNFQPWDGEGLRADIIISFERRKHGDEHPFDGPGQDLAHSDYPKEDGVDIHFDDDEIWVDKQTGSDNIAISFYPILLHEIGHALGLKHSYDWNSIMYRSENSHIQHLAEEDINRMRDLYGISEANFISLSTEQELPTSTKFEQLPNSTTSEELPTFIASEERPTFTTSEELPTSTPSEQLPTSTTYDQLPISTTYEHGRSLGPNTVMDGHWIKETITFAVLNGPKPVPLWVGHPTMSRARVAQLARQAFSEWAPHCGLNFQPWDGEGLRADIIISFERRKHGDEHPFDGPGQDLAHSDYPKEDGVDIHFDDDEIWVDKQTGSDNIAISFYPILLHEIGHALGLKHSYDWNSIMYRSENSHIQHLAEEDINRMRDLYGISEANFISLSTEQELPTSTKFEQLPNSTTSEELPTFIASEERPTFTTSEELPTSTPSEQLPTSTTYDQLPISTTYEQLPTSTTFEQLPTYTSSEQLPTSTTFEQLPTYTSSEQLPTSTTSEQLPTSTTFEQLPTSTTSEKLPTYTTSEQLPTSTTSEELPTSTTFEQLPTSTTSEKLPTYTTSEQLPTSTTSEELPTSTTYEQLPTSTTFDQLPTYTTSEQLPTSTTAEQLPTSTTYEQLSTFTSSEESLTSVLSEKLPDYLFSSELGNSIPEFFVSTPLDQLPPIPSETQPDSSIPSELLISIPLETQPDNFFPPELLDSIPSDLLPTIPTVTRPDYSTPSEVLASTLPPIPSETRSDSSTPSELLHSIPSETEPDYSTSSELLAFTSSELPLIPSEKVPDYTTPLPIDLIPPKDLNEFSTFVDIVKKVYPEFSQPLIPMYLHLKREQPDSLKFILLLHKYL